MGFQPGVVHQQQAALVSREAVSRSGNFAGRRREIALRQKKLCFCGATDVCSGGVGVLELEQSQFLKMSFFNKNIDRYTVKRLKR